MMFLKSFQEILSQEDSRDESFQPGEDWFSPLVLLWQKTIVFETLHGQIIN